MYLTRSLYPGPWQVLVTAEVTGRRKQMHTHGEFFCLNKGKLKLLKLNWIGLMDQQDHILTVTDTFILNLFWITGFYPNPSAPKNSGYLKSSGCVLGYTVKPHDQHTYGIHLCCCTVPSQNSERRQTILPPNTKDFFHILNYHGKEEAWSLFCFFLALCSFWWTGNLESFK